MRSFRAAVEKRACRPACARSIGELFLLLIFMFWRVASAFVVDQISTRKVGLSCFVAARGRGFPSLLPSRSRQGAWGFVCFTAAVQVLVLVFGKVAEKAQVDVNCCGKR